ncbi:hypothetical protein [Nonomuraea candida]|uniref:hypothetical protein n=1 Tax=Nonomuraea candida TaxID=359159 RepID=UPI0012FC093D|nr:hypothetical protein [Nonomuraea candida]
MPQQVINHYERLLDEHVWMQTGFHWTVVRTGALPPSIEEIGARLSRSAEAGIEEEVDVASGTDLFIPRSVVSVDRQKEGYFLFQNHDGGVDEPPVLRELSEEGERVWSITSILYKHQLTYAVDGEIRLMWWQIPHGDRPIADDPVDEDLSFVLDVCKEANIRFGLAALMAAVDIGSGVRMDINWPHAPRPAVIIDDPIW